MWRMLQQDRADDYVIGMGESHSVREFVESAFAYVGLDWQSHVHIDSRYFRPAEVDNLRADPTKARTELRWEPRVGFEELVRMMVDADMASLQRTFTGGIEAVQSGNSFRAGADQ